MAQYVVQPGDNPSKIARKFGMRLSDFAVLNPSLTHYGSGEWKVIFPGQIVNVAGTVTELPAETPHQPAS